MKRHIVIKPIYLLWTVCIMALPLLLGCQKEDKLEEDSLQCPIVAKEGPDNNIVGKWKLVKAKAVFNNPRTKDYSCSNIEYDFQEGGVLIVTGTSEDNLGYAEGQYPFEFKDTKLYEGIKEEYTVKIEKTSIACGIQNNNMVLDDSSLDGNILYFIRVE